MKKKILYLLFLVSFICVLWFLNEKRVTAASPTFPLSGDLSSKGPNASGIKWTLTSDGTLTITGSGTTSGMYNDTYPYLPWTSYSEYIKKAVVSITSTNTLQSYFRDCTKLESVTFTTSVANNVSLAKTYKNCHSLKTIDMSKVDSSKIRKYNETFSECSSIENISFSNFSFEMTDNVSNMFYNCKKLKSVSMPQLYGDYIFDSSGMFYGCESLISVDLSNFKGPITEYDYFGENKQPDENIATDYMFYGCSSLTHVNLPKMTAKKAKYTQYMFAKCTSLISVSMPLYTGEDILCASNMFDGCSSLTTLSIPKFSGVKNLTYCAFLRDCTNLTTLDISSLRTDSATDLWLMFYNCASLEILDVSNFRTSNVVNFRSIFNGMLKVKALDVSKFDTSQAIDLSYMFYNCESLLILDVSHFNTGKSENMRSMFYGCRNLLVLDVSGFITRNVKDIAYMFAYCNVLEVIDVSNFDTSNVEDMRSVFNEAKRVKVLCVSNFNLENVKDISYAFYRCESVEVLDVSNFITKSATLMEATFGNCFKLKELDLSKIITTNITTFKNAFVGCSSLIRITFPKTLNLSKAETFEGMLKGCSSLTTLDLSMFKTSNSNIVVDSMFSDLGEILIDIDDRNIISKYDFTPNISFPVKYKYSVVAQNGVVSTGDIEKAYKYTKDSEQTIDITYPEDSNYVRYFTEDTYENEVDGVRVGNNWVGTMRFYCKFYKDVTMSVEENSIVLLPGEEREITVKLNYSDIPIDVSFDSQDESIATVDSNGKVTGVVGGKSVIDISLKNSTDIKTSVIVNIASFILELPAEINVGQEYTISSIIQNNEGANAKTLNVKLNALSELTRVGDESTKMELDAFIDSNKTDIGNSILISKVSISKNFKLMIPDKYTNIKAGDYTGTILFDVDFK